MKSPESVFPALSGVDSSITTAALLDGKVSMPPDSRKRCVSSRGLLTADVVMMTGCREVITG